MAHQASQTLLEAGFLADGGLDGVIVQVHDVALEPGLPDRLGGGEEPVPDPRFHLRSLESDPILFPAGCRIRPVSVPFSGEKKEETALSDGYGLGVRGTPERPGPAGQIKQLVFVQDAAPFLGEQVAGRVIGRGVRFPGPDFLESDGIDGGSPEKVVGTGDKVFQVDGVVHRVVYVAGRVTNIAIFEVIPYICKNNHL